MKLLDAFILEVREPVRLPSALKKASLRLRHQVMHRLFVTSSFWFGLVLSAHGISVEIPVTTTNLDQHSYVFSVSTNATKNGVAFHITIAAKTGDVPPDSSAGLSIVRRTNDGGGLTRSIEPLKPTIQVRLKKSKRVWAADFTLSYELLKNPGLCYVFTEFAYPGPGGDLYEIKLQDFIKH